MESKFIIEAEELSSNLIMYDPDTSLEGEDLDYVEFDPNTLIVYDPESSFEDVEVVNSGTGSMENRADLKLSGPDGDGVYDTGSEIVSEVMELFEPEEVNGDSIAFEDMVIYEPEGPEEYATAPDDLMEESEGESYGAPENSMEEREDDLGSSSEDSMNEIDGGESEDSMDELERDIEAFLNEAGRTIYEGRPKRGRKLKIPNQSRADRKRLYNTNKKHVNTKGKVYKAKLFNYQFECSCLRNCTEVVPVIERIRLFSQFWNVGTYEGRCAYLMSCVKENKKKRSYSKKNLKNRKNSRQYSIYGTTVCKKALLKTLQISEARVNVALNKYMTMDTLSDQRGKSTGGWNALPPSKRAEVHAHIASFPRYVSHYTRAKTESKYLSTNLNLAKIYQLYKTDAENPVSQSFYNKVFYKSFNLRFKQPKKDTCYKCDLYEIKRKIKEGAELEILDDWHENHLALGESLQAQMKADLTAAKNDPTLECLTYDMQKTLPLPKIPTSIAYYKRQLNLYNFGIHSGTSGKGYFNVWTENEASKGTQEVGSCLKAHIMKITEPIKKLILWSDSCGGQNRSIKLVLMMMHTLHNHKTLESISLRYLLSGHSFLPNDTEFGEVETALKPHERLYTDKQYMQVMKECRKKNDFVVTRMSPEIFFSVQNLERMITNRKVDLKNLKVSWLDTHEILIDKKHPSIIMMRKKIGGPFQMVNLAKIGVPLDVKYVMLCNLWPSGRALSKDKVSDLIDLVALVRSEFRYFYEFLNIVKQADFEDDIDGFGQFIDFDPE